MLASLADSTIGSYAKQWQGFREFAEAQQGAGSLRELLRRYVIFLHEGGRGAKAPAFVCAARLALTLAKGDLSVLDSSLDLLVAGAARETAMRTRDQRRQKEPFTMDVLRRVAGAIPGTDALRVRDLLLLALGRELLLRGSELLAITWEDVSLFPDHMMVRFRRPKTQATMPKQAHRVDACPGPVCCVALMRAFRAACGPVVAGRLFAGVDGTRGITEVMRRRLAQCGVGDVSGYSSHSLRIGGSTDYVRAGSSAVELEARGGWAAGSGATHHYIRVSGMAARTGAVPL